MKWLRLYDDVLDDPKVQQLSPALFKHWINLLCLANMGKPRGTLPSLFDIAFRLRLSDAKTATVLTDLMVVGLIELQDGHTWMHGWNERQRASDDVAERVRKHRDTVTGNESVTLHETPRKLSRASDTDTDTEQKQNGGPPVGPPPPPAEPAEPDKPRPVPKARPTRVPETFAVTDRLAEFAAAKGLSPPEIAAEAEKFRDHYQATGKTMVDWAAAWRTWVVRSIEFRTADRPTNGTHPVRAPSQKDLARQSHERLRARIAAQELEESA